MLQNQAIMDINIIAQKLKDKINAQGGKLNLPDDFPIKCESIGMALGYVKLTSITLTGLNVDNVTVNGKVITIADAHSKVFGIDVSPMTWNFTMVGEDLYQCAFDTTIGGISISTLVNQGLISLANISDPNIFPTGLFDQVSLAVDTSTFTLNMLCDSSHLDIMLINAFGLRLTGLGFGLIITSVPGLSDDIQFQFTGTLTLGKTELKVTTLLPISTGGEKDVWMISFSSSTPLVQGLADLVRLLLGVNIFSILPEAVVQIGNQFSIKYLQVVFNPAQAKVTSILLNIGSLKPWEVVPGKFTIADTNVTFDIKWQNNQRLVNTTISGHYVFAEHITLGVDAYIPAGDNDWQLTISGDVEKVENMDALTKANIPGGLNDLSSLALPKDVFTFKSLDLEEFTVSFNPSNKTVSFIKLDVKAEMEWQIVKDVLAISDPSIDLTVTNPLNSNREIFGEIKGVVTVVRIPFDVSATKEEGAGGWKFVSAMQPQAKIDLKAMINQLLKPLNVELPQEIFPSPLNVADVSFTIDMSEKETSYAFAARTDGKWSFHLAPLPQVDITAATDIKYKAGNFSGLIKGTFEFDMFAKMKVGIQYQFDKDNKILQFIFWEKFIAEYSIKEQKKKISLRIGELTLGELLTNTMHVIGVNNFKLESPWTVLNDISLKGFAVEFDLETKNVSVTYKLPKPIDLVFITITDLTLATVNGKMTLQIKGKFLGKEIGDNDPFGKNNAQDVQKMPDVPGGGNQYFELRALALGQRVSIGANKYTTIPQVIDAIRKLNTASGDKIPIGQPGQPTFKAENGWLFATNFGVLKTDKNDYTVDLSVVFSDPEMYGLRIEMNGAKAKIFAGLKFEILYRKISDSVGVYQMELTLPNAMRYLDLGAVSVVLPIIGLQIYTNGDFKVDIGFPYNMDFSRSFTVQGIIYGVPVLGSGGLYFGKLSSATSTDVPKANCGQFNPVLVFGIGMQLGIGRYIDKGILKAGFSVTVVGIVEGVIATWLPYSNLLPSGDKSDVQKAYYFKLKGTIGILGKLYGTVDFKIVKASVSLTVYVMASITYESYKAIIFVVSAGVSVAVSISIDFGLFSISIDFSFSTHIEEKFQLGSDHTQDAPWACNSGRMLRRAMEMPTLINFDFRTFPKQKNNAVNVYFSPHLTVNSENAAAAINASYVSMLFIDSPVYDKKENKLVNDVTTTSFDNLSQNVFKWLVVAGQPGVQNVDFSKIPVQLLKDIYASLSVKGYALPYDAIEKFLVNQVTITASALTNNINATVFPMPPVFGVSTSLNNTAKYSATFNQYSFVDSDYLRSLSDYFDQLAVQVQKEMGNDAPKMSKDELEVLVPLSQFIFGDYFLLMAKQVIQDSIDASQNYRYILKDNDSMLTILNWANAIVPGNLTAAQLIDANKTRLLNKDKALLIGGLSYQIKANESFAGIAAQPLYQVTPKSLIMFNADTSGILVPNVTLSYKSNPPYTISPADTLTTLAQGLGTDLSTLSDDADFQKNTNILQAIGVLSIPLVNYKTVENDTFLNILSIYNIDADTLGGQSQNISVTNLFVKDNADNKYVVITGLNTISADAIFEMTASNGKSAQLAGMIARYQMHGMRLPLDGISFANDVSPQCLIGKARDCSMWSVTGQQFPLPSGMNKDKDIFKISLKRNGCAYITFSGSPDSIDVTLQPVDIEVINAVSTFASVKKLRPAIDDLSILSPVEKLAGSYSVQNYYPLRTASRNFILPYDNRNDQQRSASPAPIVWSFTPALLNLLAENALADPYMSLQIGRFNPGKNKLEFNNSVFYGYSTIIDVNIKRTPVADNTHSAMGAYTYEVIGSNEAGTALLEKLLSAMPTGKGDVIDQISLLYQPNPTSADAKGYLTDGPDNVTMFLTQVNLSTDTNPVQAAAKAMMRRQAVPRPSGVVNDKYEFIKFLWECSVVRSGGYYLYYQEMIGNNGLPDILFDREGNAIVSFLITYAPVSDGTAGVALFNYMNSVVTGEQLDTSADTVAVTSVENDISFDAAANDSLQSISDNYHVALSELAVQCNTIAIPNSFKLDISNIRYEVRPDQQKPGDKLPDIAAYFGVTQDAIKKINPGVPNFDNMPVGTLLRIPDIVYVVNSNAVPGNKLDSISRYYFITIESLAYYNATKQGIFAGINLKVTDQVLDYKQMVPQGNVGFTLNRKYPGAVPPIVKGQPLPTDYAEKFVQNEYQLLTYASSENTDFKTSGFGLPVGPLVSNKTNQNANADNRNDVDPDIWPYEQVIRVHNLAKYNPIVQKDNLPLPEDNPYAGISGYMQVYLDWQDNFGNRVINTFTDPKIDPTATLNYLPIQVGYTDTLLGVDQWPSVTSNYYFVNNIRQLLVELNFDNSRYDPAITKDYVQDDTPVWKQNAINDREVYKKIYYQLNQLYAPDPANPSQLKTDIAFQLGTSLLPDSDNTLPADQAQNIKDFISAIHIYLDKLIDGSEKWDPKVKPAIKAPLSKAIDSDLNPDNIFELMVTVGVYRDVVRVHDDFLDDKAVYEAESVINPKAVSGDTALNLITFAESFESIFNYGNVVFKIATSSGSNPHEYKRDNKGIWVVRWALQDKAPGIFYQKNTAPAIVYSARPLSTKLEGYSSIPIYPYTTGQGIPWKDPNAAKKTAFTGIDLDAWSRQFLLSIDQLLSPDYVNAAFWISQLYLGDPNNQPDPHTGKKVDLLGSITGSKKTLAGSLSDYLSPILKGFKGDDDSAREKFRQQLLIRLSDFYAVSAVVQYPMDVSVSWKDQEQGTVSFPRLYGSMKGLRPAASGATDEGFSLSNSKILLTTGTDARSYLNFIFTVKAPENQTYVPLQLEYQVSHLEHNITNLKGIADYEASDWLNFVIVPTVISLTPDADLQIPIVLRAYPTPPSLTAQTGTKTNADDVVKVVSAKQWNFNYDYSQHYALQDTIHSEMRFNLRPGSGRLMADNAVLFAALAQFIATYPAIQKDMVDSLRKVTAKTDRNSPEYKIAMEALKSFQEIVANVAGAWSGGVRLRGRGLGEIYTGNYIFSVIERPENNIEPIDKQKLVLTISADDGQTPGLSVPAIQIEGYTAEPADMPMLGVIKEYSFKYQSKKDKNVYLTVGESKQINSRSVVMSNLDVIGFQNALSYIYVKRNENLVKDKDGKWMPTSDLFVYQTPQIFFGNKLIPLLDYSNKEYPFNIAQKPAELKQHLINLFNDLIGQNVPFNLQLKIGIEYQYTVQPDPGSIEINLPVLLGPTLQVSAGTGIDYNHLAGQLQEAMKAWNDKYQPQGYNQQFNFDISVYSGINDSQMPLLRLRYLYLMLKDITAW